jgi:hypothetical protein
VYSMQVKDFDTIFYHLNERLVRLRGH